MAKLLSDPPAQFPEDFTLRDYFATIALSEIIRVRVNESADRKAIESYQIADSMIRHRMPKEGGR